MTLGEKIRPFRRQLFISERSSRIRDDIQPWLLFKLLLGSCCCQQLNFHSLNVLGALQ